MEMAEKRLIFKEWKWCRSLGDCNCKMKWNVDVLLDAAPERSPRPNL
jgi:hypothetical protein